MAVDPDVGRRCVMEEAYRSVQPVSAYFADQDNAGFMTLAAYNMDAHDRTKADPRFAALRETVGQCLEGKGFQADDGPLGGVAFQESWTDEDTLKAVLAEATCSDDLGFTQQAADLTAAYEQALAETHEAELTAIRQDADRRLAAAEAILRDAGVM
jgi:hypothetical protein